MKLKLFVSMLTLLCASPALAQTNQGNNQQDNQRSEQQQSRQQGREQAQMELNFVDTSGKQIGTATLSDTPHGVLIKADVNGLPPGMHGFHIHETGTCDAQGGFESAGGHYSPQGYPHGYELPDGPHAGDLPNQYVSQDGTLKAEILSNMTTVNGGDAPLLDDDGSALIIHSGVDDYKSQPSGDAGNRIACAPITEEQRQAMQSDTQQEQQTAQSGSQQNNKQQAEVGTQTQERQASRSTANVQDEDQTDTDQSGEMTSDRTNTAQNQQTGQTGQQKQQTVLLLNMVYSGVSLNCLIGADLTGADGDEMGEIQDIVLQRDGRIGGVVIEGGGFLDIGDATFQIPWSDIIISGNDEVRTAMTEDIAEQRGLYDQPEEVQIQANEFLASTLIGDSANVRDGQVYGQVDDIIIGQQGEVVAVLVERDNNWGGGTYGYPYDTAYWSEWDPDGDAYMLPYDSVTIAATVPQIHENRLDTQS